MAAGKLKRRKPKSSGFLPRMISTIWSMIIACGQQQEVKAKHGQRPITSVQVGKAQVKSLWDSGAQLSLIRDTTMSRIWKMNENKELMKRLPLPEVQLFGADGKQMELKAMYSIKFKMKNRMFEAPMCVVKGLKSEVIFGCDVMDFYNVQLDIGRKRIKMPRNSKKFENASISTSRSISLAPKSETKTTVYVGTEFENAQEILFEPRQLNIENSCEVVGFPACSEVNKGQIQVVLANLSNQHVVVPPGTVIGTGTRSENYRKFKLDANISEVLTRVKDKRQTTTDHVKDVDLTHIPESYRPKYKQLIHEYADIFSRHKMDVGKCEILPHEIKLKDKSKVVNIPPYRMPYHLEEVAQEYVENLLKADIIRKSTSPFSSPLMLVRKASAKPSDPITQQYRIVHNYKKVNENIERCSYPLRNLYELIDRVAEGKVYTVIDLSQGYFNQKVIDPQGASAFSVPGLGLFEYTRSPMGINSSPAFFQRLLDFITMGLKRTYVYMDDVIVSTQTHEENISRLRELFDRFRKYKVKCNLKKTVFGSGRVQYLGYDISQEHGIRPGAAKTEVIRKFKPPETVTQIKQFLGLCSFFRKVIPKFSETAAPLLKLTRKDANFSKTLSPEAKMAFLKLQTELGKRPCVQPVDFSREFILTVDTSKIAWGAILSQVNNKGIEHPVAYASSLLSECDSKKSAYHREQLGMLWAMKHFKPYLFGKHFICRTDHKPLTTSQTGKLDVLDRIAGNIKEFEPFTLQYMKGETIPSDYLSRPNSETSENLGRSIEAVTVPRGHPDYLIKPTLTYEYILMAQKADVQTKALYLALKEKIFPQRDYLKSFVMAWKNVTTLHQDLVVDKEKRIFVPHRLKLDILQSHHDDHGHAGPDKTVESISKFWIWPNLKKEVINHCLSCEVCNKVKPPHKYENMPLRKMQETKEFNRRIHLDCLTRLPKSQNWGNTCALIMVDSFTGLTIASPMKIPNAKNVIDKFMDKWVSHYSFPKTIVTDNGSEFANNAVQELCERMNIEHIKTTPYHSRSNGLAERKVRSLNEFLRMYLNQSEMSQSRWDEFLNSFNLIINSTRNTRGFTPFFLAHGQEASVPFDTLITERPYYSDTYANDKLTRLKNATKIVLTNIDKIHDQNKKQHDKKMKKLELNEGDIIYIDEQKGHPRKLAVKFSGPYTVIEDKDDYAIVRKGNRGNLHKIHKDRVRKAPKRMQIFPGIDTSKVIQKEVEPDNFDGPDPFIERVLNTYDDDINEDEPENMGDEINNDDFPHPRHEGTHRGESLRSGPEVGREGRQEEDHPIPEPHGGGAGEGREVQEGDKRPQTKGEILRRQAKRSGRKVVGGKSEGVRAEGEESLDQGVAGQAGSGVEEDGQGVRERDQAASHPGYRNPWSPQEGSSWTFPDGRGTSGGSSSSSKDGRQTGARPKERHRHGQGTQSTHNLGKDSRSQPSSSDHPEGVRRSSNQDQASPPSGTSYSRKPDDPRLPQADSHPSGQKGGDGSYDPRNQRSPGRNSPERAGAQATAKQTKDPKISTSRPSLPRAGMWTAPKNPGTACLNQGRGSSTTAYPKTSVSGGAHDVSDGDLSSAGAQSPRHKENSQFRRQTRSQSENRDPRHAGSWTFTRPASHYEEEGGNLRSGALLLRGRRWRDQSPNRDVRTQTGQGYYNPTDQERSFGEGGRRSPSGRDPPSPGTTQKGNKNGGQKGQFERSSRANSRGSPEEAGGSGSPGGSRDYGWHQKAGEGKENERGRQGSSQRAHADQRGAGETTERGRREGQKGTLCKDGKGSGRSLAPGANQAPRNREKAAGGSATGRKTTSSEARGAQTSPTTAGPAGSSKGPRGAKATGTREVPRGAQGGPAKRGGTKAEEGPGREGKTGSSQTLRGRTESRRSASRSPQAGGSSTRTRTTGEEREGRTRTTRKTKPSRKGTPGPRGTRTAGAGGATGTSGKGKEGLGTPTRGNQERGSREAHEGGQREERERGKREGEGSRGETLEGIPRAKASRVRSQSSESQRRSGGQGAQDCGGEGRGGGQISPRTTREFPTVGLQIQGGEAPAGRRFHEEGLRLPNVKSRRSNSLARLQLLKRNSRGFPDDQEHSRLENLEFPPKPDIMTRAAAKMFNIKIPHVSTTPPDIKRKRKK